MRFAKILTGVAAVMALPAIANADSVSSLLYVDQTYTSTSQSLILPAGNVATNFDFYLEDFEDGALNSPYLSADNGYVRGPAHNTDSVDTDDSAAPDGFGLGGHSWKLHASADEGSNVTFSFEPHGPRDALPTHVGAVVTDIRLGTQDVSIEGFDADGVSIGTHSVEMTGYHPQGMTDEDRFIGMSWAEGISSFTIMTTVGALEVDHIQYAYSSGGQVVPLPGPLAMGLAGLAGVGIFNRRRRKVE
jgi:hypothetical protein